jgi:hypothetical protein
MLIVQSYTPKSYRERDIVYKAHIACEVCTATAPIKQYDSELPAGWLWVHRSSEDHCDDLHFCSWECVKQYILNQEQFH